MRLERGGATGERRGVGGGSRTLGIGRGPSGVASDRLGGASEAETTCSWKKNALSTQMLLSQYIVVSLLE